MSQLFKDNCPCENCKFYTCGKQHSNPNAFDLHYCKKRKRPIVQHTGNVFHSSGTWIIPCGKDFNLFVKKRTTHKEEMEDWEAFID